MGRAERRGAERQVWTSQMESYLAEIVSGRSLGETTKMMNERFGLDLTEDQVRGRKCKLGLLSGYRPLYNPGRKTSNRLKALEEATGCIIDVVRELSAAVAETAGTAPIPSLEKLNSIGKIARRAEDESGKNDGS